MMPVSPGQKELREAEREAYYLSPVLCFVCEKPLRYLQAKRGSRACSDICGRTMVAASKIGKPNPRRPAPAPSPPAPS